MTHRRRTKKPKRRARKGARAKARDDKNTKAAIDVASRAAMAAAVRSRWTEEQADTAMQCSNLKCAVRIERGEPIWIGKPDDHGNREAICNQCHEALDAEEAFRTTLNQHLAAQGRVPNA